MKKSKEIKQAEAKKGRPTQEGGEQCELWSTMEALEKNLIYITEKSFWSMSWGFSMLEYRREKKRRREMEEEGRKSEKKESEEVGEGER